MNRVKEREDKIIAAQKCEANIICENAKSCSMLERACRSLDGWDIGNRLYKKVPQKLLIKYRKEI